MNIHRPGSPFGDGIDPNEPLDPEDERHVEKGEGLDNSLSRLEERTVGAGQVAELDASSVTGGAARAALAEIANSADLSNAEGAAAAVRKSARWMVWFRLSEKHRSTKQGRRVMETVGERVTADPFLKAKLLAILNRLKSG